MLPKPIALPAATSIALILPPKEALDSSLIYVGSVKLPVRKPTVTNIAKVGRKVSRAGRNFVPRSAIFIIYAENGAFCLHVRPLMDVFS